MPDYHHQPLWQEIKMDIVVKKEAYKFKYFITALLTDINFQTMLSYRIRNRVVEWGAVGKLLELIIRLPFICYTSCDIQARAKIEGGVRICHANGIIIGDGSIIKTGVKILHQVTIGAKDHSDKGLSAYPIIESGVTIYAGAKIFGKIIVGRNSVIGANAVVLKDVPENSVAVGIPAKIKPRSSYGNA